MRQGNGGYREYAPATALRPYVECYWTATGQPGRARDVLPDGCVDILFELSGPDPQGSIVGAMTRPLRVHWDVPVRLLAVRFRPGGAHPFLRAPLSDWTDERVPLELAWDGAQRWAEELAEAPGPGARLQRLETELVQALPRMRPVDARARAAIEALWQRPGTRVGELARELGVSRQHLTRVIKKVTGLGPKRLARVARLRSLLRQAGRAGTRDWASLAAAAGYYDQSHLIAEFRDLAGNTPARHFG